MVRNKILNTFFILPLIPLLLSCGQQDKGMSADAYADHIARWDSERLHRLKAPDGWVNLAGLFWLQEGENSIGSSGENDIMFPRGPGKIGVMVLSGDRVTFNPSGEAMVRADGEDIMGPVIIYGDGRDAGLLTVDSLGFFIIKRGERIAIRLRDYLHPRLDELQHIERYPPNREWIIGARFIETGGELTVSVPDILGDVSDEKVPGILEFEYDGETWRLFPTGSRERLFVIFADDTNALETYGAGRFLSAGPPDEKGIVHLDFNKAYNPPCAFSPYATCPLPPGENFLPFGVTAGEKSVPH